MGSTPKDVTEANQAISGKDGGKSHSDEPVRKPDEVREGTGIAGVGAMMAGDEGSETAENLERSLAVQGERDDAVWEGTRRSRVWLRPASPRGGEGQ